MSRYAGLLGVLLISLAVDGSSARILPAAALALPRPPAVDAFLPHIRAQVLDAHRKALASPLNADASGYLGMVLHTYREYEVAAAWYTRARMLALEAVRWTYLLAVAQDKAGRSPEAIANLREVLRHASTYQPARIRLADLLFAAGQLEESRRLYEAVLRERPSSPEAHYGLARALAAKGEGSKAVGHYLEAVRLVPEFGAAHYALALVYRDLGEAEKTAHHLAWYRSHPLTEPPASDPWLVDVARLNMAPTVIIKRAESLIAEGRLDAAVGELERLVSVDPRNEPAHTGLAGLYGQLRQWDQAEMHFRRAIELNPNSLGAHFNYGRVLFERQQYDEAAKVIRRALEIDPHDPRSHTLLGRVLERQGRRAEAIRHYRLALEADPNQREAHYVLGLRLLADGNAKEGIAQLERTLTPLDARTPAYMRELAMAHERLGRRDRARSYLREASRQASAMGRVGLAASIDEERRRLEESGRRP